MVNVLDVEQAHLEEIFEKDYGMDRLKLMFNRQRELMAKYHDIEKRNGCLQTEDVPVDLNSTLGQQRLKDLNSRVCEELYEAANCLHNKPWKCSLMETDVDHYYEELADAWHFFIEMLISAGIDEQKLFELYFNKSEVNKFRQRSNY